VIGTTVVSTSHLWTLLQGLSHNLHRTSLTGGPFGLYLYYGGVCYSTSPIQTIVYFMGFCFNGRVNCVVVGRVCSNLFGFLLK
jgi:hypothetical protein